MGDIQTRADANNAFAQVGMAAIDARRRKWQKVMKGIRRRKIPS
jgi:hypothetical protein